MLHWLAINEDSNSEHHQHALHDAKEKAERAVILAGSPAGIPSSGAVTLLQNDPKIQGARLLQSIVLVATVMTVMMELDMADRKNPT